MNILITGGASGLGLAITQQLASNKENTVHFTYCNSTEKAIQIKTEHSNTVPIKCNFKDTSDIQMLNNIIIDINLNVLINNAYTGDLNPTHFHKTPSSLFLNDFMFNVIPTIEITQAAIQAFRKQKQGKIITILSSYLANTPPAGLSSYIAGKAYLEKLTKVWATENTRFNITSNSVSPSFMQTNLNRDVDERIIEQLIENHPLKQLVTVEEVAETVEYLTKASNQINGVDILMNAAINVK